jgi:hypothetical protein
VFFFTLFREQRKLFHNTTVHSYSTADPTTIVGGFNKSNN